VNGEAVMEILWWIIGIPVGIAFAIWWLCTIVKLLDGIADAAKEIPNDIKNSDWYKTRQERKEIEALGRKVLKKKLEDELQNQ
jgi:hypothetical protein